MCKQERHLTVISSYHKIQIISKLQFFFLLLCSYFLYTLFFNIIFFSLTSYFHTRISFMFRLTFIYMWNNIQHRNNNVKTWTKLHRFLVFFYLYFSILFFLHTKSCIYIIIFLAHILGVYVYVHILPFSAYSFVFFDISLLFIYPQIFNSSCTTINKIPK